MGKTNVKISELQQENDKLRISLDNSNERYVALLNEYTNLRLKTAKAVQMLQWMRKDIDDKISELIKSI